MFHDQTAAPQTVERDVMSHTILIVDDERNIRRTFGIVLRTEGHEVLEAESGEDALAVLARKSADVVILDVRLPGIDGLETLRRIKQADPQQTVIMISGHGTIATAVTATREGAGDFLEKPCSKERLVLAVQNALRLRRLDREVRQLKAEQEGRFELIGESTAMRQIREQIARLGPSNARILIQGESGTGKELIARAIHAASPRRGGPFVKVNCAAIPEELIESELFGAVKGAYTGATESRDGKFLQADGGTLFLDEVGDMSLRAQAKVLRALQEGEIEKVGGRDTIGVDVRVLAATNKNLADEVASGRFREDLFFRLNVVPLVALPLRERTDDVPLLATHYLARYCAENNLPARSLEPAALEALCRLPWPGNVRQLHNVLERLVILARTERIGPEDLCAAAVLPRDDSPAVAMRREGRGGEVAGGRGGGPAAGARNGFEAVPSPDRILEMGGLVAARRRFEEDCIRRCLQAAGGNVSQAARLLGIDRTNLHKKMQNYGIKPEKGLA
jgi:two-component system nitrogen regulation response regulator NtrX